MIEVNYAQGIYSHQDVLKMLKSNRIIRFEYVIRDRFNKTKGSLSTATGSISFDSHQAVMRTCSITARKSELLDINSVDDRIVPYFCILAPNNTWLKYPLGVFIVNPSSELNGQSEYITVVGYDLAEIANTSNLDHTILCQNGTPVTSHVLQRVSGLYTLYDVTTNANLKEPTDVEYEIGATELETINAMLESINYFPLYFDENGKAIAEPYIFPENMPVQLEYSADRDSIIFDGISRNTNLYTIPNKFVRYTDDADSPQLRSEYIVTDASIPSSTTARGRVITDIQSVSNVASQATLDSMTRRAAIVGSQPIEELVFDTALMPGHGYKNSLHVRCKDAGIDGKYIEYGWDMDLSVGGVMTHKCYKAVNT